MAQVAGQVAVELDRLLADARVEVGGPVHRLRRRQRARRELHERHQVRRVVRVCGEAALRAGRRGLDVADGEAGRARADERPGRRRGADGGEHLALDRQVFPHALLHVGDAGDRRREVRRPGEQLDAALGGAHVGEAAPGEEAGRLRGALHGGLKPLAVDVVQAHLQAGGREEAGPACSGQAGPDDGHRAERGGQAASRGRSAVCVHLGAPSVGGADCIAASWAGVRGRATGRRDRAAAGRSRRSRLPVGWRESASRGAPPRSTWRWAVPRPLLPALDWREWSAR